MRTLRKISGDNDLHFYGYGGTHMKNEGFDQQFNLNVDNLPNKTFHTFRKAKNLNPTTTYKWNPLNIVNKHYMR